MPKATTLPEPWLSLSKQLGGPGALYLKLQLILNCSNTKAKRLCRGHGLLTLENWVEVQKLLQSAILENLENLEKLEKLETKE